MNILDAMDDPAVFGQHFRADSSWSSWRTFLSALFALPMPPSSVRSSAMHRAERSRQPRQCQRLGLFVAGALARASCLRWSLCSSPASRTGDGISHPASVARS